MTTICLPTLNAIQFLKERINSILAQTLTDWEVVVCDSYSDDGTWEYLQSYKNDPRFHLYQVPREGLYAGWNECLKRAKGEYTHFATADDTCSPNFLEALTKALERESDADVAFSDFSYLDKEGRVIPRSGRPSSRELYFATLCGQKIYFPRPLSFAVSCHFVPIWNTMSGVVFRRSLIDKIGMFPRSFGSCGDVYWSMAAAIKTSFIYINEKLATWRIHDQQATFRQDHCSMERWIYRAVKQARSDFKKDLDQQFSTEIDWRKILYQYQDLRSREMMGLNRHLLKSSPQLFIQRIGWLLKVWPSLVVSQFLKGFSVEEAPIALDSLSDAIKILNLPSPVILQ